MKRRLAGELLRLPVRTRNIEIGPCSSRTVGIPKSVDILLTETERVKTIASLDHRPTTAMPPKISLLPGIGMLRSLRTTKSDES